MQKDNVQDQINELKEQNQLLWRQINAGKKRRRYLVLALAVAIPLAVFAASIPNTFVDGEIISAAKINANFQAAQPDCPSGFTEITNGTYSLGCIQTNEEGSATCATAVDNCFTKYGGRLPSWSEMRIGFSQYSLNNTTGNDELLDVAIIDSGQVPSPRCAIIQGADHTLPSNVSAADATPYRCFIPR